MVLLIGVYLGCRLSKGFAHLRSIQEAIIIRMLKINQRKPIVDFRQSLQVSSPNFLYQYFSISLLVFQVLEVAYLDRDAA